MLFDAVPNWADNQPGCPGFSSSRITRAAAGLKAAGMARSDSTLECVLIREARHIAILIELHHLAPDTQESREGTAPALDNSDERALESVFPVRAVRAGKLGSCFFQ
jgi:hypothetical protein